MPMPAVVIAAASFIPVEAVMPIAAEVAMFPTMREAAAVAVMRIEAVIHVAVEASRAMEPWTGPDEESIREPFRSVIAIGGAIVWSVVEVAVGTYGFRANIDAKIERHLCICR